MNDTDTPSADRPQASEPQPPRLESTGPYGKLPGEEKLHPARPLPIGVDEALTASLKSFDEQIDSDLEFLRWLEERKTETVDRLTALQAERAGILRAQRAIVAQKFVEESA